MKQAKSETIKINLIIIRNYLLFKKIIDPIIVHGITACCISTTTGPVTKVPRDPIKRRNSPKHKKNPIIKNFHFGKSRLCCDGFPKESHLLPGCEEKTNDPPRATPFRKSIRYCMYARILNNNGVEEFKISERFLTKKRKIKTMASLQPIAMGDLITRLKF